MSHRTSAEIVLDSITPYGDTTRLTSMYVVFPKMVLGERNRHRAFSLSDRSSRAVPTAKLLEEVRSDPAMPAKFRRLSKGMGGGEELTGGFLERAQYQWRLAAESAAQFAEDLSDLAKEIANRGLDPYIRMHGLMTATHDGWMNFFGLRLDAGADPTIQVLAQRCFEAYRASTPRLLQPGEWHLPFVDEDTHGEYVHARRDEEYAPLAGKDDLVQGLTRLDVAKRLSAARCAHLSYNDLETGKRMTIEKALAIYDRLITSRPIHASPTEHQATPDRWNDGRLKGTSWWENTHQHGNLHGWRQARKMIPGEAVAELPEAYR